jgi:phosphate transport system permease protein
VTIFNFAMAADDRWNALAWGGSLVLVLMVLVLSIAARYFTRGQFNLPK